jgi:hypothetical protein
MSWWEDDPLVSDVAVAEPPMAGGGNWWEADPVIPPQQEIEPPALGMGDSLRVRSEIPELEPVDPDSPGAQLSEAVSRIRDARQRIESGELPDQRSFGMKLSEIKRQPIAFAKVSLIATTCSRSPAS